MQFFDRPAVVHEMNGQIVEKLRMRWRFAASAKVAGRRNQSVAEMPQPDAVDDDAGGEGIVFIGDGLSEFEPAGAVLKWLAIGTGENREKLAGNFITFHRRIAAFEDARILLHRPVFEDQRMRRRAGGGDD